MNAVLDDDCLLTEPLATRMRPRELSAVIGQEHLLAPGKPLHSVVMQGKLHSMILWGPPGTGKTTLAQLLAEHAQAQVVHLSAILSGVKELRDIIQVAKKARETKQQTTVLFIDEIHRFNKAQQDVFLPFIENGTVILIGATTENPSFELNRALLSRARVYVLKALSEQDLLEILNRALHDEVRGLGKIPIVFEESLQLKLVAAADGDARQVLNLLEILFQVAQSKEEKKISLNLISEVIQNSQRQFDNKGEFFYDQISALHKSIRGSSPDAALYWLCRMLDGGCDPHYLARRIIRAAIEDIGLADPRALELALHAAQVYQRLGSPEGELALAQAVIYLASTSKSNASYKAYQLAMSAVQRSGSLAVPLHLRNAPTSLMKELGYGKEYRYAHDEQDAYVPGEQYLPDQLCTEHYYEPTSRGLEAKIKERLAYWRSLDQAVIKNKKE